MSKFNLTLGKTNWKRFVEKRVVLIVIAVVIIVMAGTYLGLRLNGYLAPTSIHVNNGVTDTINATDRTTDAPALLLTNPAIQTPSYASSGQIQLTVGVGFIGDSITKGTAFGASGAPDGSPITQEISTVSLGVNGNGYTILPQNDACSGTTTSDWLPNSTTMASFCGWTDNNNLLTHAMTDFKNLGDHYVSIMLGSNDARTCPSGAATSRCGYFGISAATYNSNLTAIANKLISNGFIVILNTPPYQVTTGNTDTLLSSYQSKIITLTNGSNLKILPGDTTAYTTFQSFPGYLGPDGLHPCGGNNSCAINSTSSYNGVQELGTLWGQALIKAVANPIFTLPHNYGEIQTTQ